MCTYFYKQQYILNFLISPSSEYCGAKQTTTTIMRGLVPSFTLILHPALTKTPLRRAEKVSPKTLLTQTNCPTTDRSHISIKTSQGSSHFQRRIPGCRHSDRILISAQSA